MCGGSGYDLANQDARLLSESMRIKIPARNAPSLAARAGILLKNLLDMEGFVELAAYWVHRLNALQLGNTSLHTCNGFFSFINRVLLLIQVILAFLGSKRLNVAALTTIKNGRQFSPSVLSVYEEERRPKRPSKLFQRPFLGSALRRSRSFT